MNYPLSPSFRIIKTNSRISKKNSKRFKRIKARLTGNRILAKFLFEKSMTENMIK